MVSKIIALFWCVGWGMALWGCYSLASWAGHMAAAACCILHAYACNEIQREREKAKEPPK